MLSNTLVIVSYRYGHLAAQAVDSALSQIKRFDEVVFIDDGVGDCQHIERLYPEVRFQEQAENLGTVRTFQNALMRVTTDRVMFLGADNWLRGDALQVLASVDSDIVSYDICLCGTQWREFSSMVGAALELEYGYAVWRFREGDINQHNHIHGSALYHVGKAQAVGYRASGRKNTEEDWMLFKGMIANGATHAHVSVPLLFYRRHRENFNKI